VEKTIAMAMARFDRQLAVAREHRLHKPGFKPSALGDDFAAFHCLEYDGQVSKKEIAHVRS